MRAQWQDRFDLLQSKQAELEAADAGSSAQDTQALDHAVEREEREALEELAREQKALQAVEKQLEQAQLESAETRRKLETALVRIAQ